MWRLTHHQPTEASNKDKIVGSWEVTKGTPPGGVVEFTKDGKLKMTAEGPDKKPLTMEGTYAVDGDSLKVTMKGPGGKDHSETSKITKLTDKEMAFEEKQGDKTEITEFKKK